MRSSSSGFTMIEVLVAMLVVGTGALAMLMLQLQALRSSGDAAYQAHATAMAMELAELRAAHRAAAPDGPDPYLFSVSPAISAATANYCTSGCDAPAFTGAVIAEWSARLARELPSAQAVVCHDSRSNADADWRCDDAASAPVIVKLGWRTGANASAPSNATPLMALPIGR